MTNHQSRQSWKDHNWFFSKELMDFNVFYEFVLWGLNFFGLIGWICYSGFVLENELILLLGMICFIPTSLWLLWRASR